MPVVAVAVEEPVADDVVNDRLGQEPSLRATANHVSNQITPETRCGYGFVTIAVGQGIIYFERIDT